MKISREKPAVKLSSLVSIPLGHGEKTIRSTRDPFVKMVKLVGLTVRDIRFPTSLELHGSDAMVRHLSLQKIKYRYKYGGRATEANARKDP